jgi:hypothetical protein
VAAHRVSFFEAAILDALHAETWAPDYRPSDETEGADEDQEESDWKASVLFGKALIDDARLSDALGKLARHETTLMNAFTKTLQMLLLLE